MSKEENKNVQDAGYSLPSKIASYGLISSAIFTAKEYYNWGKEASPVVAFAEAKVESGISWLVPMVEPYLETAKPYLQQVDSMGTVALNRVEENIIATKDAFGKKVNNVDVYLRDSLVATPLNVALNVTEKVVNHYIPPEGDNKEIILGPISKTTYLSKRIQHQAFLKLHNLSLRAPDKLNGMEYTVDLIKYAQEVLDNGISAISKGVQNGTTIIKETPKEMKEKVQTISHDALAAIHTAMEVISKQIPNDITTKFNHLKDVAISTDPHHLFSSVAQSSSKMLQDARNNMAQYIAKGENIPQQILSSTYNNLHRIVESLFSFIETKPTPSPNVGDTQ